MEDELYLSLTLYGEARGEPIQGIVAVASIIRNRVLHRSKSYMFVCLEKAQFSCWNIDDANYPILTGMLKNPASSLFRDKYYIQCNYVAKGIINGQILSNISTAENYMTIKRYKEIKANEPKHWANKLRVLDEVGSQVFLV